MVVTGAARGIGAEIARRFAAEGARLVVLDLDGERLAEVAASVAGAAVVADVADPDATRSAMAAAIATLGGLDVLVNNAGILQVADVVDITVEDWDRTFATNVRSMLVTTQAAVPALRARRGPGGS